MRRVQETNRVAPRAGQIIKRDFVIHCLLAPINTKQFCTHKRGDVRNDRDSAINLLSRAGGVSTGR